MTDSVLVTLRVQNPSLGAAPGFGKPLILSHNADWEERTRTYTSLSGVLEDWDSDSPEAIAARQMFAQSPCPASIGIGRAAATVTQQYELDAGAARDSYRYAIDVVGEGFEADTVEHTTGEDATLAEIHNALVAGLNAVTDKTFTAAFAPLVVADFTFTADADDTCTAAAHGLVTGDGPVRLTTSAADLPLNLLTATDYWIIRLTDNTFKLATSLADAIAGTVVDIGDAGTGTHTISDTASTKRPADPFTVTADASGNWFALEVSNVAALAIAQNHAAGTVDEDLAAILLEDASWYWLVTLYNSTAYVEECAAWVEANGRAYIPELVETDAITTAYDDETSEDALAELVALSYKRIAPHYHHAPQEMLGAALTGRLASLNPGSWTAKFKTLTGVSASPLSTTHRTNLATRRANGYAIEMGRALTFDGMVGNADFGFLDVTVGLDAFVDDLRRGVMGVKVALDKVAYDDRDIAKLEAAAIGSTKRYSSEERPVLRRNDALKVIVPRVVDIPSATRAERTLPDFRVQGELAGAVHTTLIDVTVSP